MKVQLKQEFAMFRDEGEMAVYFGVPFYSKHVKITGGKFAGKIECQWFADKYAPNPSEKNPASWEVIAKGLVDAYRADVVAEEKAVEPKHDNNNNRR